MKLSIEKEVFGKFSKLNIGVIVIKDMDNTRSSYSMISKMLKDIQQYCRDKYVLKGFSKSPYLTNWKKGYGSKVKVPKYHTAVENLLHDVLLKRDVKLKNNLVDLYRYFMLKDMIPIGGDDLDKVKGDINVKIAKGWEVLRPEHTKIEHPKSGEIVFMDGGGVLARRWSWHESEKTKITHHTQNAIIYFDGLPPVTYQVLESVMKEYISLLKTFVGGKIRYKILNFVNTSMRI
ncbi:MAG: phenylalanine--tRNA ligase beta subunit-related protein [Nanoarchaeota archaeon]|nr:phenylalanine--tRNA ligase beta subunit-related protein [Nanoarchaeota archaeon]